MYTVGLSTCGRKPISDALFAAYRAAGIGAVEITVPVAEFDALQWDVIAETAARQGVKLWSCHLPFNEKVRIDAAEYAEETAAWYARLIRKAACAGVRTFVVHPSSEPIADADRPAHMRCAQKYLAILAEVAGECGAQLAVEDLPRTCLGRNAAEMEELRSAHPALRVCVDTNHLLGEDPAAFVRTMGPRIITTHISDYDFRDERHWLPGEGGLDWSSLLQALQEVGYRGPWLYEVSFARPGTLEDAPALTCEDFARNAAEIFAGKKPTPRAVAREPFRCLRV